MRDLPQCECAEHKQLCYVCLLRCMPLHLDGDTYKTNSILLTHNNMLHSRARVFLKNGKSYIERYAIHTNSEWCKFFC
jgi:hypothetical protein